MYMPVMYVGSFYYHTVLDHFLISSHSTQSDMSRICAHLPRSLLAMTIASRQ
jgi:hypothetical protein